MELTIKLFLEDLQEQAKLEKLLVENNFPFKRIKDMKDSIIAKARFDWNSGNKIEAVKAIKGLFDMGLVDAKNYCDKNFGTTPTNLYGTGPDVDE